MNATDTLAAEFVTVYPQRGHGHIHAVACPQAARHAAARITTRPTNPAAIRNGLAAIAACCKADEARLFTIYRAV